MKIFGFKLNIYRRGRICSSPFFISIILFFLLIIFSVLLLTIGGTASIFSENIFVNNSILWNVRLPKLLASILIGSALSLSGFVFQNVLKNPLADPYILGISGGAATGIAIYITFASSVSIAGAQASAFLGSMFALSFLLLLLKKFAGSSTVIVLIGIGLSFFLSSIITFLISGMQGNQLVFMNSWLIGSISNPEPVDLLFPFIIFVITGFLLLIFSNILDVLVFGDDFAATTGINTKVYSIFFIFIASFLTASCVAVCGSIGFVGLIIPHITKLIIKDRSINILPVLMLLGAVFLTLCNTIAGLLSFNIEIPVGVVTSFIGAPILIYLLFRKYNVKN